LCALARQGAGTRGIAESDLRLVRPPALPRLCHCSIFLPCSLRELVYAKTVDGQNCFDVAHKWGYKSIGIMLQAYVERSRVLDKVRASAKHFPSGIHSPRAS